MHKDSLNNDLQDYMFDVEMLDELTLTDTQQAELDSLYDDVSSKFKAGKVISGTIIAKDNSGVLVDIDYKSNGLISTHEFSSFELERLSENDEIEVLLDRLEDVNGNVVLSYQKAKSIKAWDKISELAAADEPVEGVVTHKVKGGLSVDVGIPAFLPGSQVDIQRVSDFDQFVNQPVTCKILKVNRKRGNVIVSRRKFLEEQRVVDKRKALETITEGQVVQGLVKNITNYGAFVDVGGVDGLLHITDMSWGRINHPSELVKMGDTISVKIITFDRENEKISLGMKQLTENPWAEVEKRYPVGQTIKGRISSITDYGLFVEVEKGIEGLVHISEVSWTERISNLAKHFNVGDDVEVAVVAIDKDNRRMSLSVKQLQEDPWKVVAEQFKIGDKITGQITNITDFGLFVQLHNGVDGLVHVSDISWTEHITHPGDRFKKGDSVEAVVLSMDIDHKKISLGIKQLDKDPWENIESEYPVGKIVQGTVSKITNFGAFVRLDSGIEGLVHISEFTSKEGEKPEDVLKVGQTDTFKVIKVNREDRKLGLSFKAAHAKPGEEVKQAPKAEAAPKKAASPREPRAPRAQEPLKGSLQQALASLKEQSAEVSEKPAKVAEPAEEKAAVKAKAAAAPETVAEAQAEPTKPEADAPTEETKKSE